MRLISEIKNEYNNIFENSQIINELNRENLNKILLQEYINNYTLLDQYVITALSLQKSLKGYNLTSYKSKLNTLETDILINFSNCFLFLNTSLPVKNINTNLIVNEEFTKSDFLNKEIFSLIDIIPFSLINILIENIVESKVFEFPADLIASQEKNLLTYKYKILKEILNTRYNKILPILVYEEFIKNMDIVNSIQKLLLLEQKLQEKLYGNLTNKQIQHPDSTYPRTLYYKEIFNVDIHGNFIFNNLYVYDDNKRIALQQLIIQIKKFLEY